MRGQQLASGTRRVGPLSEVERACAPALPASTLQRLAECTLCGEAPGHSQPRAARAVQCHAGHSAGARAQSAGSSPVRVRVRAVGVGEELRSPGGSREEVASTGTPGENSQAATAPSVQRPGQPATALPLKVRARGSGPGFLNQTSLLGPRKHVMTEESNRTASDPFQCPEPGG